MKRFLFYITLFCLAILISFSFANVSASPILELNKNYFQPGETILGKISISDNETFQSTITQENLKIFQSNREISFASDIIFANKAYFFYIYPTIEGDYSIKVSNILYKTNDNLASKNIQQVIQVKSLENSSLLSIKPGFIKTTSEQTPLVLENKGNTQLNITLSFQDLTQNFVLRQNEQKTTDLTAKQTFSLINIQTQYENYSIPLIYIPLTKIQAQNLSLAQISTFLNKTPNITIISETNATIEKNAKTCSELGGEICTPFQNCTGTPTYTGELCCIGKCSTPQTTEQNISRRTIYAIIIIVALAGVLIFILYKFLKTKQKTTQQYLKQKITSFEKKSRQRN